MDLPRGRSRRACSHQVPNSRVSPSDREGCAVFLPISSWFAAFVLTVVVEVPLVLLIVRRDAHDLPRLAVLVAFVNLATHLAVWYVASQLLRVGTIEYVMAAEFWAIGAEALFYVAAIPSLRPPRAVLVSATANLASFLVGRLLEGFRT